ncbi:MAG: helix-turn-helix transcriptional regulator [Kiritimatiellia bacterium]
MNATEKQEPAVADPYLDTKEGAKYIKTSERQFYRLRNRNMFPTCRLSPHCVRFRRSDLDRMMSRLAVGK